MLKRAKHKEISSINLKLNVMIKSKIALIILACCISMQIVVSQAIKKPYKVDNETFELLKSLSKSRLNNGEIYLFTTTHQDIAWLDHPEACIINRDTMWLTPFFERLEKEPDFKMDIEQSSIVMEYIHRHPEKKEMIKKYLKEGRICIGATFVQPYEEMYLGESLARQFYLGKRWLKKTFNYSPSSYFNVDVPGRTLQMPQIMQKAQVENLIISRHERGLFYWEAPDGSKVRTYTPGHYIFFYNLLAKTDVQAIKELANEAVLWYSNYNDIPKSKTVMPAMLNYEFIWDQKPVKNCIPFMNLWNNLKTIENEQGKTMNLKLPKFKYAIADEFFTTLDKSTSQMPTIRGERPNVWVYIHSPSHEKALTASREGDILLPATEKIFSFSAMAEGSFTRYPQDRLNNAWKDKIYPDHGWGGKNGVITDNTFLEKYRNAQSEANSMIQEGTTYIASKVNTEGNKGIPLVVFNSLSWSRKDPAVTPIHLEKGYATQVNIKTTVGNSIPCQLSNVLRYEDGSIKSANIHFIADVLPMGYSTYYLTANINPKTENSFSDKLENDFYKIELSDGGIKQIVDKELGINVFDASKFLGGEIITMQSVGNGAGEFDAIQKPSMQGFDKISNHKPMWKLAENGDVYTSFIYRSTIRNAVIEQTLKIYHQIKKIDIDIAILNWEGVLYREFRMMLPIDITNGKVTYDVPYGVLTVGEDEMPGAAGERYYVENKDQHPRGIGNWIGVSDDKFGITMSSSVGVADYIDPTTNPVSNTILQPILLASRKSCHGQGNEYSQYGDHFYHFSFTTHKPGWKNGFHFGQQAREKLTVVYNPLPFKGSDLPQSSSFFNIKNKNVVISTIKKCEDDNSLIVRMYNIGNNSENIDFESAYKPKKIVKVNLIEEELGEVSKMVVGAKSIETFKFIY